MHQMFFVFFINTLFIIVNCIMFTCVSRKCHRDDEALPAISWYTLDNDNKGAFYSIFYSRTFRLQIRNIGCVFTGAVSWRLMRLNTTTNALIF